MKQKIVIKVTVHCGRCRTEAMMLAAAACGVISVAWEGDSKNKLVVIGEGVDAAELTRIIRKKFKCAALESVEEVKPKKDDKKPPEPKPTPPCYRCPPPCPPPPCPPPCPSPCESYRVVVDPCHTNPCTIM